jgi:acyl transferase domain-containing protein
MKRVHMELALTEIAGEERLEPGLVAGHGLGEFAAAVAAGVLSAEELGPSGGLARAARLVCADLPAKTAGSRADIVVFLSPAAA